MLKPTRAVCLTAIVTVSFLVGTLLQSCSDPAFVGEDIVDRDVIDILQSDTFRLQFKTMEGEDLVVYDPPAVIPNILMAGVLQDEVFGNTHLSFYMQFRTITTAYEFNDPIVDSVVLILEYDSTRFYGPSDATHSIDVFQVTETMDPGEAYPQSQSFPTEATPLGSKTDFDPDPVNNVTLIDHTSTPPDTVASVPHLRIPLDLTIGEQLLSYDSTQLSNDTIFWDLFKGLYVSPSAGSESGEIMSFRVTNNNSTISPESISRLSVYYHEVTHPDTIDYGEFRAVLFSSTGLQHIEKDYSGSIADQFIESGTGTDSLIFLEGYNGLEAEIELPDLTVLGDVLVNKAELRFVLADIPGINYDDYAPINFLKASLVNEGDSVMNTDEYNEGNAIGRPDLFGGAIRTIQDDTTVSKRCYIFNLSQTAQKMIDGTAPQTIRLTAQPKRNNPSRSVLFGLGDISNAAYLRITYTVN